MDSSGRMGTITALGANSVAFLPRSSGARRRHDARRGGRCDRVVAPAVTGPPQEGLVGADADGPSLPAGNYGWPVLGETLELLKDMNEFGQKRVEMYGNIFKSNVLFSKSVAVCGLEALKTANELEAKGTIVRRPLIPAFKVFGQESLLTLNGSDHSRVRKLLHPAFSKERVESYIPYIVETAKEACAKLSGLGCFSMTEEIRKYAFKVSTSSFLGMEFQSRSSDEVLQILEEMANGIYTLGIDLPFTKFGKAMRHRAELLDIVNESILAMKRSQPEGGRTNKALQQILDARDEDGNGLDMAIIVNTIILMLYGGYDTVSTTMDTIFHALALDPQIWDKLREEQRQVVESFGDDITAESLASMPFAEVVVKEGLRTNPVAPFTFKFAEESFELGGYHIPAGWKVLVGAGFTMRYMDGRWRDADAFRPERFLEPGADRLDTFLAFGMGAHMCLGKELALTELRVMLAVLARGYEVRLQNPHARMMAMPIPHLEDGCMATVRRLQASGP